MSAQQTRQVAVLLADRLRLFLDGAARAVRMDTTLRLVAEVHDASAVLDAIRRYNPDVAIVDEDLDAIRLLGAVTQQRLATRVALLASEPRPDVAIDAVAAGAVGYISKRVGGEALCDAVRRIAAGESVFCNEAQTLLASEIRLRQPNGRQVLTDRELEVLSLMAEGLTFPEIGCRLHVARSTVKSYADRVYQRLGVRDRLGAVVEGMRRGILD